MPHRDPDARKAYARRYAAENPEKVAAWRAGILARSAPERAAYARRAKYGTDGQALRDAQENKCAICRCVLVDGWGADSAQLDHDHVSGRIRGWLCRNCNVAIGHMKDDPRRLRAAIDYLEKQNG